MNRQGDKQRAFIISTWQIERLLNEAMVPGEMAWQSADEDYAAKLRQVNAGLRSHIELNRKQPYLHLTEELEW